MPKRIIEYKELAWLVFKNIKYIGMHEQIIAIVKWLRAQKKHHRFWENPTFIPLPRHEREKKDANRFLTNHAGH